jgi:hypothetical protein
MIISKLFEEQYILSFLTLPRSTPFARVPKSKVLQVSETCSASGEIYIQILLKQAYCNFIAAFIQYLGDED